MSELDLTELRKIAEAARGHGSGKSHQLTSGLRRTSHWFSLMGMKSFSWVGVMTLRERRRKNRTQIATFDPPTVLALITRLEQAEESARLVDNMLRAVLEAMGTGPETDPIIKARQIMDRLKQAERELRRERVLTVAASVIVHDAREVALKHKTGVHPDSLQMAKEDVAEEVLRALGGDKP